MRTSRVRGVCRRLTGGRVLAVAVAAGMVTAMVGASSGMASASVAAHRPPRPAAHAARSSRMTLAQAPGGLRAAVRKTLGRRATTAGSAWSQQAELTDPGATASDNFGWSVAISGNTAAIGTIGVNLYAGAVYVFVRSGSTWTQQTELTDPPGGTSGDDFGSSVALSGSTLVVGASNEGNQDTGVAYVYTRSGTTWSQQGTLTDPLNEDGDAFGSSVAISGNTIVVGAQGTLSQDQASYSGPGAAYVFTGSGGTWTQAAMLNDPGQPVGENDDFGAGVAITGSTLAISAPGTNSYAGATYVFTGSGSTWTQQAAIADPAATADDFFGTSVALSGSTLVVGARGSASFAGAAYVYTGSGGIWTQQTALADPAATAGDLFGYSVAIDGSTVVIGASGQSSTSGNGAAYVYTGSGGTWTKQATLTSGASSDNFGGSVAVAGSTVLVGADNSGSSNQGAAYVFVQSAPASPCRTLTTTPTYKHVIVIMDENQSYSKIIGSSQAPYLNSLAKRCGLASNYHNITHNSVSDYLGITSGLPLKSLLPFDKDCLPSACHVTATNIFNQAGSWKDYAESMPSNCDKTNSGTYAVKVNPAVYYTDLSNCATHDVPLGTLTSSALLKNFSKESTAPAFAYVTGNLCDDMHGATGCKTGLITAGDTWLSKWVPAITSTRVYKDKDTVIIVTWDEGTGGTVGENCVANTTDQSCHIPAIVIAPSVKAGTVVSTQFSHYSWLKTAEQLLGKPQLGQAKTAASMKTAFHL